MNCSLCNNTNTEQKTDKQGKIYNICTYCGLIQLDKKYLLSKESEKKRYLLHENSKKNKAYVSYLKNIIENSIAPFLKTGIRLLDFGCGPEMTWADLLKQKGYHVSTFDPYFDNNNKWRNKTFDAITAIEVFEHLISPGKELSDLSKCLKTGNFLIIRTMLHNNDWNNFLKWWYKTDSTHVSFYSETTINFICMTWNYKLIQIIDQCEIVLMKL
jgi:SAM-dependent methyltransferase